MVLRLGGHVSAFLDILNLVTFFAACGCLVMAYKEATRD